MRRSRWAAWILESGVIAAVIVVAFWWGRFAFQNAAAPPDYYWMSPAVTIASGQSFGQPRAAKTSALYEFLTRRRATLDVQDAKAEIAPPDQFDYSSRYLYYAVGYWWKVVGISWAGVADVAAAQHVLAALGVYATLRLFTPMVLSALGALWISTASLQLMFVPHVRDYSKGAFIVAAIPLLVVLAIRARSRRSMLGAAVGLGVIIGIGVGFRRDITVLVPIAIACIVLFRGARPWTGMGEKAQAVAVLLLTLFVTGYPIFTKFSTEGSNSYHVILLGYADPFDDTLGIKRSVYRVSPYYDDSYIDKMLAVRGELSARRWPPYATLEYDRAARALWFEVLRHFPGDEITRVLAACNSVLNLLFENPTTTLVTRPFPLQSFSMSAFAWLNRWNGWGLALGIVLIIAASSIAPRLGWLAAFLVVSLGGYPSLQFGNRHYFHLQLIPVFAVLTLIWATVVFPSWIRRNSWRDALRNVVVVAIPLLIALVLPLRILRAYQSRHVEHLISGFLTGPRTPVEPESIKQPDGKWLLRWPDVAGRKSTIGPLSWAYYLIEFRSEGVQSIPAIALRFRLAPTSTECQRVLYVPPTTGIVRFGVETYSYPGHEFEGFEVEERALHRVAAIYRMAQDGPERIPTELRLPPAWEQRPLYQRFLFEGENEDPNLAYKAIVPFATCS